MKKTERVTIGEDRTLTVFVGDTEHKFSERDYLKSDKGKILLRHGSVMRLAEKANVVVGEPVLIATHSPVIYVFSRSATYGSKQFTAIGETNRVNLFDNVMLSNPASTADNRAYERAVLSVLGLYGDLYGASEINYKDKDGDSPSPVSKTTAKTKKDQAQTIEEPANASDSASGYAEQEEPKTPVWWNDTGVGVFKESELDPETCIVTLGSSAGKNWTVKQLYDYDYKGCMYFAERSALDKAKDDLRKQVYACRRAIRKYGMQ